MRNIIFLANFIFAVSAIIHSDDDGNTDVTMEIEGKEIVTAKKLLYNMQDFLHKLIKASGKKSKMRMRTKHTINMNEFFRQLCSIFGNLDREEIEVIVDTIESEIKKRRLRDKNYRALLKIPVIKRSLENSLQTLKDEPPRIWKNIARKLYPFAETSTEISNSQEEMLHIKSARTWSNKLVSRAKVFFRENEQPIPKEFNKIIDDLEDYSKHYVYRNQNKETNEEDSYKKLTREEQSEIFEPVSARRKLVEIVKDAMDTFDQNTNLDEENHEFIQQSLQFLWSGPNKYATKKAQTTDHKLISTYSYEVKSTSRRRHTTTEPTSVSNDDKKSIHRNGLPIKKNEYAASHSTWVDSDENADTQTEHYDLHSVRNSPSVTSYDADNSEEGSLERNGKHSKSPSTLRMIKDTGTSPRTKKLPKMIDGRDDKKYGNTFSTEFQDREIKENNRIRDSREKNTKSEKTTSTTRGDTILESAEKKTTKEKSVMDTIRELLNLHYHKNSKEQADSKEDNKFTDPDKSQEKSQEPNSKLRSFKMKNKKEVQENKSKNKNDFDDKPETDNETREQKKIEENAKNIQNSKTEVTYQEPTSTKRIFKRKREKEIHLVGETGSEEKNKSKESQRLSGEIKYKKTQKIVKNKSKGRLKTKPDNINEVEQGNDVASSEHYKMLNSGTINQTTVSKVDNSKHDSSNQEVTEVTVEMDDNDEKVNSYETNNDALESNRRAGYFKRTTKKLKETKESTMNYENEITLPLNFKDKHDPLDLPVCNSNSKCNINSANLTVTNENSTISGNKDLPVWSSESEFLYKALDKQSKKVPLKNLLNDEDLLYLKKLNISLVNENNLESSTDSPVIGTVTENTSHYFSKVH